MESAARSLKLRVQSVKVQGQSDFENAFRAAVKVRAQALITIRTPLINDQRKQIADLAVRAACQRSTMNMPMSRLTA